MAETIIILFALASIGLSAITTIILLAIHRSSRNRRTSTIPTSLHLFAYGTSAAFICLVVAVILIPRLDKSTEIDLPVPEIIAIRPKEKEEKAPALPVARHLDVTPMQFAMHFNKTMRLSQLPFRINPIVIEGTVKNTFTAMLNDYIGIVGTLHKGSEYVEGVIITGGFDDTDTSGKNIIMTAFAGIAAIFPDIEREQIRAEVQALMDRGHKSPSQSASRIFNNVKLTFNKIDLVGNSFIITPVE